MSDEKFLIVSYVLGGLASLGLAVAAYAWLRPSFAQIVQALPHREHARLLQRSFPLGTILFALAGFFSVSYTVGGCEKQRTYENIIADHAYLVAKNQEQIAKVCHSLMVALFFWGIVVLLTLLVIRRAR